jgi:exodeoxyribonuclease V gamma subunit
MRKKGRDLEGGAASMRGLNLYVSNRMEILAEKLADVVDRPLVSPLTPEIIVVESRGMERLLSM